MSRPKQERVPNSIAKAVSRAFCIQDGYARRLFEPQGRDRLHTIELPFSTNLEKEAVQLAQTLVNFNTESHVVIVTETPQQGIIDNIRRSRRFASNIQIFTTEELQTSTIDTSTVNVVLFLGDTPQNVSLDLFPDSWKINLIGLSLAQKMQRDIVLKSIAEGTIEEDAVMKRLVTRRSSHLAQSDRNVQIFQDWLHSGKTHAVLAEQNGIGSHRRVAQIITAELKKIRGMIMEQKLETISLNPETSNGAILEELGDSEESERKYKRYKKLFKEEDAQVIGGNISAEKLLEYESSGLTPILERIMDLQVRSVSNVKAAFYAGMLENVLGFTSDEVNITRRALIAYYQRHGGWSIAQQLELEDQSFDPEQSTDFQATAIKTFNELKTSFQTEDPIGSGTDASLEFDLNLDQRVVMGLKRFNWKNSDFVFTTASDLRAGLLTGVLRFVRNINIGSINEIKNRLISFYEYNGEHEIAQQLNDLELL